MMKALLADDHYPVLEFLQHSIPWKELGIEIIGLCHNGSEALECCEQTLPDILVTDIGMPKVDGLTLIRQLKERNPKLQTIILSCHDEFQYAQQAVSIGVTAYILKETMQPEEITTQLRSIVDKLQGELSEQQKKLQMQRIVHETHSLYKAEFMRKSLHNPVINEAGWTRELQELGVHIHTTPYMPVLLYPNNAHLLQRRFQNGTLMGYAFDNVIEELIDRAGIGVSFQFSQQETLLLFPFPKTIKQNQYEVVRGHLTSLLSAFQRLHIRMSAAMSEPFSSPAELRKGMQELLVTDNQRFYAAEGSIYKRTNFATSSEDIFSSYQQALDDIKQVIAVQDRDRCSGIVREWIQYIRDGRFQVDAVRAFLLKLLMDIEVKYSSLLHFHGHSAETLHKKLLQFNTLEELQEFIDGYVRDKITLAESIAQQSKRPVIYEAQKYVSARLHEKISMEDVARHLGMNPSHFSRIYKSETGETFIEYVTRIKMEQAKEAFEQSDITTQQVAQSLGYDNTSYFIKLFRTHTGYSPKEYRFSR